MRPSEKDGGGRKRDTTKMKEQMDPDENRERGPLDNRSRREEIGTSVPTGEGAEQTTLSAYREGRPRIGLGRQIEGSRRIIHTGSRDSGGRQQGQHKTKRLTVAARGQRRIGKDDIGIFRERV